MIKFTIRIKKQTITHGEKKYSTIHLWDIKFIFTEINSLHPINIFSNIFFQCMYTFLQKSSPRLDFYNITSMLWDFYSLFLQNVSTRTAIFFFFVFFQGITDDALFIKEIAYGYITSASQSRSRHLRESVVLR